KDPLDGAAGGPRISRPVRRGPSLPDVSSDVDAAGAKANSQHPVPRRTLRAQFPRPGDDHPHLGGHAVRRDRLRDDSRHRHQAAAAMAAAHRQMARIVPEAISPDSVTIHAIATKPLPRWQLLIRKWLCFLRMLTLF